MNDPAVAGLRLRLLEDPQPARLNVDEPNFERTAENCLAPSLFVFPEIPVKKLNLSFGKYVYPLSATFGILFRLLSDIKNSGPKNKL